MRVINENNLPTASIVEFAATQGNLKFLAEDNYKKLKSSIERRGFYIPVMVWEDEKGQKWLLDGHQRKHVLETEGWMEPIPYISIPAKSREEAAEMLLEITSQFGTITQEGLDEYIAKFKLPEMDVLNRTNFDAIFDFSIEVPEEEEEEAPLEVEEPKTSIKLSIVDNGEYFVVKSTEQKKANTIGSYTQWEEAQLAALDYLQDYEPEV